MITIFMALDILLMLDQIILSQEVSLFYEICDKIDFKLLFVSYITNFTHSFDKLFDIGLSILKILIQHFEQTLMIILIQGILGLHHGVGRHKICVLMKHLLIFSLFLLFN